MINYKNYLIINLIVIFFVARQARGSVSSTDTEQDSVIEESINMYTDESLQFLVRRRRENAGETNHAEKAQTINFN